MREAFAAGRQCAAARDALVFAAGRRAAFAAVAFDFDGPVPDSDMEAAEARGGAAFAVGAVAFLLFGAALFLGVAVFALPGVFPGAPFALGRVVRARVVLVLDCGMTSSVWNLSNNRILSGGRLRDS